MKSRKLGFLGFGKRKKHENRSAKQSVVRLGVLESLEKRELMTNDLAASINARSWFPSQEAQTAFTQYIAERVAQAGGSSSGGSSGEYDGTSITVSELEPNNGFTTAQTLNFGNRSAIVVNGVSANAVDDEFFKLTLNAGDILDVRIQSSAVALITLPFATLLDSSRKELITSQWQPQANLPTAAQIIPLSSPLTGGGTQPVLGDVVLHYVIPTTASYYIRLNNFAPTSSTPLIPATSANYQMFVRRFRPTMEAETVGTKQILYLDFEGGIVNLDLIHQGLPGSARLSPTRDFLAAYGLQDSDEGALIDAVTAAVKAKFDNLGLNTTNPNFGIDIRNSKDSDNIFGQPNVTRVIIGGTNQELLNDPAAPSGLLGVSQTIDPGNFSREDTVIVMHDTFLLVDALGLNPPVRGTVTKLAMIAEQMATVIAHEAGHSFGAWHQDPNNTTIGIMDAFYDPATNSGAGVDGIFGTDDDKKVQFTKDRFGGAQPFLPGATNDTINWLGWALSTGQTGATIQGVAYRDINLNRSLDTADSRLSGFTIYADLNNNGVRDAGEFSALSGTDGSYSLKVPTGATYIVKAEVPTGYRVVAPTTNSYTVAVSSTAAVTGRNFGFELLSTTNTGTKFNDTNGNGLKDTGETGVKDVWVYYDLDGDGRLDIGEPSTKSKADGTYILPNIGAGTYTIREVIEPGWVQTFPGTAAGNGHTITLTGNALTDALVLAGLDFGNQLNADFGDAPSTYGDASAGFVSGLMLGTAWDSETGSQYSTDASGDDNNGNADDEDGVGLSAPLVRGAANNAFNITTTNTTGQAATLSVWLDLDRDGTFSSSEKIANPANFAIASTVATGPVVARFRYGFQTNVGPTGYTSSGEVEDHIFNISDTSSIAVNDVDTVPRNGSKIINVLANDFAAPGEVLKVISASGTTSAGGSAAPTADGSGVLYIAPQGFIGTDTFQYTVENSTGRTAIATVTIDVSLFFANPVAVDDSFDLPTNSIDFPLNVLANDIEGQNGALTIVSVVQPDKGGQISIATGGKSLRYTPPRNFGGTEFVSYTVSDSAGNTSTATVTLHTLEGDRDDDQIQIRAEAVSLTTGLPISQIQQGQDFKLKLYVDDLRHDTANPGSGSGVFAAYFDLLYNLQLVSTKAVSDPSSRFNFEVSFLGDYVNFTTGDGSIPGVINEFGATSSNFNMQAPNELPLAEITFTARSPGIVKFSPDPADISPRSDSLLFDTPDAVPIERIRYRGTQIQIFGDGVQFPVAVDDSTRVFGKDSARNQIRVLDNDLPGSTNTITIVGVTQGSHGFTSINRGVSSLPVDDYIEYTPATGYSGFDQFTYTIEDTRGIQSTATVTVHVGTAGSVNPDSDDIIDFELLATDLNGTPIDQVTQGQQFQLRAFVKDLRTQSATPGRDTRGIFAAYQDVLFNRNLVSAVSSTTNDPNLGFTVSFGPLYNQVREGDILTKGVLNEIGAVATFDNPEPTALNPQGYLDRRIPLFTVTMTADRIGTAEFFSDPVDIEPLHESLTFDPAATVTPDKIHFGYESLRIVSASGNGAGEGFHNFQFPEDVDNNGYSSPFDALYIINLLNSGGGGYLGNGGGEGEPGRYYPDINNDGSASPIDALLVINHLNRSKGHGEGESAAPSIDSENGRLSAEGESTGSVEELSDTGSNLTGPESSNYYMGSVDDWFGSQSDDDDEESLIDDLANDVNTSWKS